MSAPYGYRTPTKIRRAAAIDPKQPLQPGSVGSLDSHRGIDREAAAVVPSRHLLRIILIEIALAEEPAKDPLPNSRLHPLEIGVCEHRLPETHRLDAFLARLEHSFDDTAVEMMLYVWWQPLADS